MNDLISKKVLYQEIVRLEELVRDRVLDTPSSSPCYIRYSAQLNERTSLKHLVADFPVARDIDKWIPVSERLPQLPDGKSLIPLNATILAPSGLRNTVQMTWELKRGKPTWCYSGAVSDWNVIAWQPLPEPWKEGVVNE